MQYQKWFIIMVVLLLFSCGKKIDKVPELTMTHDQIVNTLVNMYTANAMLNINDGTFRDSTSKIYFQQVSEIVGQPIEVIRSDFEKLLLIPDTLLVLHSRALDTLRALQENQLGQKNISIGIN